MHNTSYSPSILQYIPFLYVIWSDDLLSISEVAVVKKNIEEDTSLSNNERTELRTWLNKDLPPQDVEIKKWRQAIVASNVELVENDPYPLTSLSLRLVSSVNGHHPGHNEQLRNIERHLGMQPNHYRHLFPVAVDQKVISDRYRAPELDTLLKGPYAQEIDAFREFLSHPVFSWEVSRDKEAFREKVLQQLRHLAKNGYGSMAYPEAYGGTGNMALYGAIFENLIFVDGSLTVKFGVQFGLFGGSIQKLGTQKHHDTYLGKAGQAKLLGCFAMTETGHGSNVRGIKTTATYDPKTDSIVIHTPGENDNKEYIGNALHSKMASVFAQLIVNGKNQGVHAILVPLRNEKHQLLPGIKIVDNGYKLGLNGVDNGKIWFDQVHVPRENLLDRYGEITTDGHYFSNIKNPNKRFFTMLGTLVGGRICVAKGALGGAKMALALAIKYALKRRQFNDNIKMQEDLIMDYPSHQLRLIPAVAHCYVYHFTLERLMETYADDSMPDKRKVETQAAALKSVITWFANDTIQECREACGGKGYLIENRIADLKGDIDIFTTFEGDNTVLLQLAAKGILSDFTSEFNSAGFTSVLKLLGSQINDKMTTINPLYSNKVDKEHLFNPKFHRHAFDYRTRRLTYTAAMRIRAYIKKGMPSYQAFLKVQTHLLSLGKAYAQELAYHNFREYVETLPEGKYRSLLDQLGILFALSQLRADASWYLEQGYLGSSKSKAIRQRAERLCSELRPHINSLVDGFGIPEHCMGAPLIN
ncbi:MAG: acyl-CoA dehydrogenase [Flavobacteriaceae bacterium]